MQDWGDGMAVDLSSGVSNDETQLRQFWLIHLITSTNSYAEGIEVLYETNTIHMSGEPLFSNLLPRLLPLQHLRNIKSLEVVLPLKFNYDIDDLVIVKGEYIKEALELLADNLPGLTQLHVALKTAGQLYLRKLDAASFFAPLDAFMCCQKPRLASFAVSPSESVFNELLFPAIRSVKKSDLGAKVDQVTSVVYQFWRNLDGSCLPLLIDSGDEHVLMRRRSPYPCPPAGVVVPGGDFYGEGYWVVEGNDDHAFETIGCERPFIL